MGKKPRKHRKKHIAQESGHASCAGAVKICNEAPQASFPRVTVKLVVVVMVIALGFVWSYWPTFVQLIGVWSREPDYSHGFLVIPFAVGLLWLRRDSCPAIPGGFAWLGLLLMGWGLSMRVAGALLYVDAVDGWSIPFFVGGVVCLMAGWKAFLWSAPSLVFLWFMVPLPYQVERWFSLPLQQIATKLSCVGLRFLGQPALAEGNTIWLNDYRFEVEQACSGLRIFMAIAALGFVYAILSRQSWWERSLVAAAIAPIALAANAARIITTGMLSQHVSTEAAQSFSHDAAGWAMIVFSIMLFAIVLWYVRRLFPMVEPISMKSVLKDPAV